MYRRYSSPETILQLPLRDGVELLLYAFEKEEDDLIFRRWVQNAHNYMSFDSFKAGLTPAPPKSEAVILEDVGNILTTFEGAR